MESNHCVCTNDYTEVLKNLINSILSSSGILHRTNSPATDSGYTQINSSQNSLNSQSNSGIDFMSTGFYLVMMLIGVLIVLTGRPKKKNSECK